jgi:hypothetical protein
MPEKYNNIIYKLSLRSKKIIKITLSSITRIEPIVYIEDSKKIFSVDYIYIKEDTKVEETTITDTITTGHSVKNNTISVINLNTN